MRRRTFIAVSMGTLASSAGLCSPGSAVRVDGASTAAALAFGTTITMTVVHPDARVAGRAICDALAAAQAVDRLMSVYSPSSQVYQLNRDGVLSEPDARLLAVLSTAQSLSAMSRGAFDITVQPLWRIFRDAADAARLPERSAHLQARSRVNWQDVEISAARVAFKRPGMAITLNGLAQGYAADLALAAVRAHGIDHALLDTGEFAAAGRAPGDRPWRLGVPDPRDAGALAAVLPLERRCLATSGDYASSFTPDFVHHHIFDPATGDSPQDLASVSVLAPSAILADGLSTAFMVMGARKAHALAARLDGVDLMTINKRGIAWKSPGFPRQA